MSQIRNNWTMEIKRKIAKTAEIEPKEEKREQDSEALLKAWL